MANTLIQQTIENEKKRNIYKILGLVLVVLIIILSIYIYISGKSVTEIITDTRNNFPSIDNATSTQETYVGDQSGSNININDNLELNSTNTKRLLHIWPKPVSGYTLVYKDNSTSSDKITKGNVVVKRKNIDYNIIAYFIDKISGNLYTAISPQAMIKYLCAHRTSIMGKSSYLRI